jgi:hypothetical protein
LTALTPSVVARSGGTDASAGMIAATNGDTMPAGPNNYLHVKNASGAAVTVTATPPAGSGPLATTIGALALSPTVAATTGDMIYGPFPTYPFGDGNGNVTFTYSATASVTVKALTVAGS